MLVLYNHPYSQHARRVVSLLEEVGLAYDARPVALDKGEHRSPEYRAINPNGQVPALVDGDVKVFESNAILRYICLKHELSDWYPGDLKERAEVEQWLDWNQCRLGRTAVDIVLNSVFLRDKGDQAAVARGWEALPTLARILDQGLAGRDFLAGAQPTIADLSVGSTVFHLGFAGAIPQETNIQNWFQRLHGLRGFKKSLPKASEKV